MQDTPTPAHLAATQAIDADHALVAEFAREHARGATDRERAVALTHAVRDSFLYDPYRIDLSPVGMRASTVLTNGYGWCVPKAALLAAVCRAAGIPARLGFADVRNHMSTERMRQTMKTDMFIWHGYADIWIDGAWRKATPAFNLSLCEKFGLHPLDFDGEQDSIYHAFDKAGNRHMEYTNDRGKFDDLPLALIDADFRATYPNWLREAGLQSELAKSDFLADVDKETQPGQ
ncbi:transglutaminase-like domain-containing protein [Ottowia thiooxydans]|uniref:Transglutaminase-like putative cysteine protease n=1 Tax=Ottowia thiooxydans TaxID=219182 RepID=A0ABV2Q804_9BURK